MGLIDQSHIIFT